LLLHLFDIEQASNMSQNKARKKHKKNLTIDQQWAFNVPDLAEWYFLLLY
jgi:hypothetical protein